MEFLDARCVDVRIRDIVLQMRERGYETSSSCAGHKDNWHPSTRGFIQFEGEYSEDELVKLAKDAGLNRVSFDCFRFYGKLLSCVRFTGLGGRRGNEEKYSSPW